MLSIPEKLNIVLSNLSHHDRLHFLETLEKHPDFLEPILKSIDLKLNDTNSSKVVEFELKELNRIITQAEISNQS